MGFIFQHQRIYDAMGNRYYDLTPFNNSLELRGNGNLLDVPSLGWLGALALVLGVLLGALMERQK